MAFGFRRSLKIAGPLRLNLSKSGLGLSLGVPGLHVGMSPHRRPYVRAGIPGTGIYYRESLKKPRPPHTAAPETTALGTPWIQAIRALLAGDAAGCLEIASTLTPGPGLAFHIEVGKDIVVTLTPDACGIAVLRAEALERLGRKDEAIAVVQGAARSGCEIARIVAMELQQST